MLEEAFWASALGGLFWLDRYQIGQLLLSRPVVVGPVVGWALGNVSTGLAVGALFEVLWLRRPPIGGFIAPEVTFSSSIAASAATIVGNETNFDIIALALLSFMLFMPLSFIGSRLDLVLRIGLGKLAIPSESAILDRSRTKILFYFIASLLLGFMVCFVAQIPLIIVGSLVLGKIVLAWPENMVPGLKLAYFVIPALGGLDMLAGNLEKIPLALFLIGVAFSIGFYFLL
ncbi:MAG: PTS sugar transporter subunit IIC [Pseudomonadota bacterium]